MIIPLDKLISVKGNKYLFTRAAMNAVDKIDYLEEIPGETKWKIVPNILKVMCDENINYELIENDENEAIEAASADNDDIEETSQEESD